MRDKPKDIMTQEEADDLDEITDFEKEAAKDIREAQKKKNFIKSLLFKPKGKTHKYKHQPKRSR